MDKLKSSVFLSIPHVHQLCVDIGYSLEDLLREIDDQDGWVSESGNSVLSLWLDNDAGNIGEIGYMKPW